MRPGRAGGIVRLILANVAVFAGLVLVSEITARVVFPREIVGLFNDPLLRRRDRPFVMAHAARGFALRPGFVNKIYRINAAGFRGGELPPDVKRFFTIIALG